MQKRWKVKEPDIALKNRLSTDLGISSLFAQLLVNRGIVDSEEAGRFLRADLQDMFDPFLMKGMDRAVNRLNLAISRKEPVFIATDFDVDGVTSCTLLEAALKHRGVEVAHYVPHRIKNGYGLNSEAVVKAKAFEARVFVGLDCGIGSIDEVAQLNTAGIDVIIIDHHEPSEVLPSAYAILNPKQKDCTYPFKELASVGLVFKLVQALGGSDLLGYLDIVALGTVADVSPLVGENRIFVRHGLDALNQSPRMGLKSLMEAAGIGGKKISTHSISFMLAPRLNASGRVDSALTSLDLLLSDDRIEADRLAEGLNENNRTRQRIEERVLDEAMDMIEGASEMKDDSVIVVSKEDWHPGVLGIVASKIVDRYYRPAIVISLADGVGRGSARSVQDFHIYEALCQCGSHLVEFGGHKYAAGLTINKHNIAEFRKMLNKVARECFRQEMLSPLLEADAEIPLALVTEELLRDIDRLSPFGEANKRPLFISRDLLVRSRPMIVGKNTLKFWVSDGEATYGAVGFGLGGCRDLVANTLRVDIAYCLGWDQWNQDSKIQLEVKDIKISS